VWGICATVLQVFVLLRKIFVTSEIFLHVWGICATVLQASVEENIRYQWNIPDPTTAACTGGVRCASQAAGAGSGEEYFTRNEYLPYFPRKLLVLAPVGNLWFAEYLIWFLRNMWYLICGQNIEASCQAEFKTRIFASGNLDQHGIFAVNICRQGKYSVLVQNSLLTHHL